MKKVCLSISLVFALSSNAQIGGLLNKAKDKLEKKGETNDQKTSTTAQSSNLSSVEDDGMTSDFHKNNVGKIVFSKKHIEVSKENPAEITGSFGGSDPIYARFYFPSSLYNIPIYDKENTSWYSKQDGTTPMRNEESTFVIEISIDGKKFSEMPEFEKTELSYRSSLLKFEAKKEESELTTCSMPYGLGNTGAENPVNQRKKITTIEVYINPNAEDRNSKKGTEWPVIFNALNPGEHKVHLKLWGWKFESASHCRATLTPICEGDFTVTKKAGENLSYGPDLQIFHLKSEKNDQPLELKIKSMVESKQQKDEVPVKVYKVGFDQNEFAIHKDYNGNITHKTIGAWFVVKDMYNNCKIMYSDISQDYNNGQWGSLYMTNGRLMDGAGGAVYVNCQSIK